MSIEILIVTCILIAIVVIFTSYQLGISHGLAMPSKVKRSYNMSKSILSEGSVQTQKHDSHEDKFWAEQVNILLEYLYDHHGKHQIPEIYLSALDNIQQNKTPMSHQSINLFLGAQKRLKYELEKI